MGKILVTGASGNVGKYVVEYLAGRQEETVAAGTRPEKLEQAFAGQAECRKLDFADEGTFGQALKDVDRVFVMRPPQMGKPEEMYPFLRALNEKGGIRMVVFLSLLGVEKNPAPPHHKIERFILQQGLPYCFMRPSFFMQNISGVHAFEIKYFNTVVVPVRRARTSFIDAKDIGAVSAEALLHPEKHVNQAYDLTGPEAIDYYEAARILSEELSRPIEYADVPPGKALYYWIHIRKLDPEYAKVMNMLYRLTRMGMAKTVTDDFERIMGRKANTFREFVRENTRAWEERGVLSASN